MQVHKIPFSEVPQLSKRDRAYVDEDVALRSFYKYPVSIEAFADVIKDKQKDATNRTVLVEVLNEQYAIYDQHDAVKKNIHLLSKETTFTVTTAHQPSLFTGPLYYIYKIISTINLAKQLNTSYPAYQFVPVFVTGGEDHDFEEVNHVNLFNKKLVWESGQKGAVGEMSTESLAPVLEELKGILGTSENASKIFELIHRTHTSHNVYSKAIIELTHELFKANGLVILNMNTPKLKRLLLPIIKEELLSHPSKDLVDTEQAKLGDKGFKSQAFPRAINLFYLDDQVRERIIYENELYKINNTLDIFTEEDILEMAEFHPELFSPNVITRPLYQELVLPNLAYIGGGGELAYWMERTTQFEHYKINFPMLIRRNSVLWVDQGMSKKVTKLGLQIPELFGDTDGLLKYFVQTNTEASINLEEEKKAIINVFEDIKKKVEAVDKSLVKTTNAEEAKAIKSLEQLEGRLMKAEKQKFDVSLNQIKSIKEKLFPSNGLQERKDNFLSFYLKYGDTYFDTLKAHLNPLDKNFIVIEDRGE